MSNYPITQLPNYPITKVLKLVERLVELYAVGTAVEILLDDVWLPGIVVRHDPPAVWVQLADGRAWFVTNRQRIRLSEGPGMG